MFCINVTENMNASIFPLNKGGWLTSNKQTVVIKKRRGAAPYALNESTILCQMPNLHQWGNKRDETDIV